MKPCLESLLTEAVNFESEAFEHDEDISGADLVDWFAQWRLRARSAVRSSQRAERAAIYCQRFRSHLTGALQALRIMQDRAQVEAPLMKHLTHGGLYPPPSDSDLDTLIHAINNGGIQVTDGEFNLIVFKRTVEESPCKRR